MLWLKAQRKGSVAYAPLPSQQQHFLLGQQHHQEQQLRWQSRMLSLIISTIVFFLASFFLHRYFEDWGLDKGRARTLLVLTIASILSWGSMALVDHFTGAPSLMDTAMKMTQVDIR
jgi:hypothetical protein